MNRRTLFGRLATVAAAATVAAHVEPSEAEAASRGCGYRYADGDVCVLDTAVHDYEAHVGHERWMQGAAERQQQMEMVRGKLMTRREFYAEQGECADCLRVFTSEGFVLPDAFKSPAGEKYSKVVQRAVHERAIREGVSHEEVAITMYWSAFPTYSIEPMIEMFVPGDVVSADMFNQTPLVIGNGDAKGSIVARWNKGQHDA